ncbi:MAG: NAD-binding protein [Syntrophorhabdaceae bacterium]|nr:NAD-binding protein [Syntrophorhabdaceae bacterium]
MFLFIRRLRLPVISFAVFLILCVLAYSKLENIGALDALFWIFHPHAIHPDYVQNATKALSLVIYFGVLAFQIWVAERVFSVFFRKEGREAWKAMVNEATLDKIHDHFIVCGYGEVGRTVVEQLKRMKVPFVLIEKDESICKGLMSEGVPTVCGDANRKITLYTAGIERAQGICIVIDSDTDNLYITVTAKALNPKLRIITRAGKDRYARAMKNSGADEVIIPEYEGGMMVGRMISKHSNI